MKIYGREYGFRLSVGAAMEIAALCPEGKLEKIDKLLEKDPLESIPFVSKIAEIESKAFEEAIAFEKGNPPRPHFTKEMGLALTMEEFRELTNAAMEAFHGDAKPTVEVDADAVKKKRKPKTTKSRTADQNE